MRTSRTLARIAISACITICLMIGVASANRLSFSSQSLRFAWTSLEFSTSFATIRCGVTLEGSLHESVVAKTAGSLIGHTTRAAARHPCTSGEVWLYNGTETLPDGTRPNSLPWHKQYDAYTGVLASGITGFIARLLGLKLLYRTTFFGVTAQCEYTVSAEHPLRLIFNLDGSGRITGVRANEALRIPASRSTPPIECPDLTVWGTGTVTVSGSATAVSIRLA